MTLECDCQIRSDFRAMSMLKGTSLGEALHRSPKKTDNYQLRISLHQLKSFNLCYGIDLHPYACLYYNPQFFETHCQSAFASHIRVRISKTKSIRKNLSA